MTSRIIRNNKKIADGQSEKDIVKIQKATMLIEDLLYSLRSQKVSILEDALEVLANSTNSIQTKSQLSRQYESEDPNKHFLIGVLPRLFQDKALFPLNDDIVEFSGTILGVIISRSSRKRSRYEIIGNVICEVDILDELKLTRLVQALEKLVGNKDNLKKAIERKKMGDFSWNETIQDLLSN
jgi:chemotaxis protein histidine kinase CheA